MLRNYFKVTIRNLIRNKLFAVISTIGLSIGIACCLLIFMYVQREFSFDSFHDNKEIYRIIHYEDGSPELAGGTSSCSNLLRDELVKYFPEVKLASRVSGSNEAVLFEDKSFNQLMVMVDPDFFNMFSFNLIQGTRTAVLNDINSIVISKEMSEKYFINDEPIGKRLTIPLGGAPHEFIVSGVIENAPRNSSIQYDFLISSENMKFSTPEKYLQTWNIILFSTFVQLNPNTNLSELEQKITAHVNKIADFDIESGKGVRYSFQPITNIHLNPALEGEMVPNGDPFYSYLLLIIAFSVLLIACINFAILTIGKSYSRSKEVGLRKVLGANKGHIRRQFFGEAFILSLISLLFGVLITELMLPTFNKLSEMELELNLFDNFLMIISIAVLILFTTFLAGFYPAMVLSKFVPIKSIRRGYKPGGKKRQTYG
ncbi:MAG: ABC transporter permease [Candidatus Zixiibacteriota bacterium]